MEGWYGSYRFVKGFEWSLTKVDWSLFGPLLFAIGVLGTIVFLFGAIYLLSQPTNTTESLDKTSIENKK